MNDFQEMLIHLHVIVVGTADLVALELAALVAVPLVAVLRILLADAGAVMAKHLADEVVRNFIG